MVTFPSCVFLLLRLFFNLVDLLGLCCLLSFYEGSRLNPDVLSLFFFYLIIAEDLDEAYEWPHLALLSGPLSLGCGYRAARCGGDKT